MTRKESAALEPSPFPDRETRRIQREKKRDAILITAVRMFNEHGFHATSLDDVAARLGISKPVVYHYLGNKDRVLFECVQIGLAQLREAVDSARGQPGTGLMRLETALRRYAEINMEDFGRCVTRTGDELLTPESRARFRALKREIDDALRVLVQEAVDDGSAESDDVRLATFTLTGALNWPARWHREEGKLSRTQIAERMVRLLLNGIRTRSPQAADV